MCTYDYRTARSVDLLQDSHNVLGRLRVKVTRRLVRYYKLGIVDHCSCDGYTLLLASGEFLRISISLVLKSYDVKNELNRLSKALLGNTDDLTGKGYVLEHGLCLDKSEILVDHANLPSQDRDKRPAHGRDVKSVYVYITFCRNFLTGNALH